MTNASETKQQSKGSERKMSYWLEQTLALQKQKPIAERLNDILTWFKPSPTDKAN